MACPMTDMRSVGATAILYSPRARSPLLLPFSSSAAAAAASRHNSLFSFPVLSAGFPIVNNARPIYQGYDDNNNAPCQRLLQARPSTSPSTSVRLTFPVSYCHLSADRFPYTQHLFSYFLSQSLPWVVEDTTKRNDIFIFNFKNATWAVTSRHLNAWQLFFTQKHFYSDSGIFSTTSLHTTTSMSQSMNIMTSRMSNEDGRGGYN